jgi:hypothetical protein
MPGFLFQDVMKEDAASNCAVIGDTDINGACAFDAHQSSHRPNQCILERKLKYRTIILFN